MATNAAAIAAFRCQLHPPMFATGCMPDAPSAAAVAAGAGAMLVTMHEAVLWHLSLLP